MERDTGRQVTHVTSTSSTCYSHYIMGSLTLNCGASWNIPSLSYLLPKWMRIKMEPVFPVSFLEPPSGTSVTQSERSVLRARLWWLTGGLLLRGWTRKPKVCGLNSSRDLQFDWCVEYFFWTLSEGLVVGLLSHGGVTEIVCRKHNNRQDFRWRVICLDVGFSLLYVRLIAPTI